MCCTDLRGTNPAEEGMTGRAAVVTMIAACTLAAAAGPAAAATAARRASTGTPGSSAVTRLPGPGARWLRLRHPAGRGWRARDDHAGIRATQAVTHALSDLRRAAAGTDCVLPPMRDALALRATGGEIAHALRDVWGVYRPQETL